MDKKEQIVRECFCGKQAEEILALRGIDPEFFDLLIRKASRIKIISKTGNLRAFERLKEQERENYSCLLSELTLIEK